MSYDGFFIRDYVGETIDGPKGTSWTNSPDIISTGPTPLADPASIENADNYNKGLPQANNQTPLTNNWVYVRGVNPQTTAQTSTVFLYCVDTSMVLWPQNWISTGITVGGEQKNWITLNAPPSTQNQGIKGTITPFGWVPPRNNTHYCLVAWANNGSDQTTPPDLGSIGSVNDMANFILTHPNVGWKNTTEVDATVPTIQGVTSVVGPSAGGQLTIGLQCQNIPTDGYVQFAVPGPDAANTIIFPKTKVTQPNAAFGFSVVYPSMPGGYVTQMSWTYYQGATPVPDGANVIPFAGTLGNYPTFIEDVRKKSPKHLVDVQHFGTPTEFLASNQSLEVGIKTLMVIGSVPFKMTRAISK